MPLQSKPSVNSFGYFLEEVQKGGPSTSPANDCVPAKCDDPQLQILQAIRDQPEPPCALDLMKMTRLPPTILFKTLQTMKEFGLVKVVEDAGPTQFFEITPCGLGAIEIYCR